MKKSAGLAIIKDDKLLLCHPTNARWEGTYSLPKGKVEEGETNIEAAIRETMEETGILIPESAIEPKEYEIEYMDKNNKIYKKVYYYIVWVENYPDIIPKHQLQLEEVDWVGFLNYEEAQKKVFWRFNPILELLK